MAKFPAFPLWTDAYVADTSHLSDAEHGRYILLLIFMWRAPGHRLPNSDEWLAKKFARTVEQVQSDLRPVIREFFKTSRHWITQGRLDKEFNWLLERSDKQARFAKARWDKEKTAEAPAMPPHPHPHPHPEQKKETTVLRTVSKKAAKPRSQIGDFVPEHPQRCEARSHWDSIGRADLDVEAQFLQFQDHHKSRGSLMADWPAAWRTWYRNAPKMNRQEHGRSKADRPSAHDNHFEGMRQLREELIHGRGGSSQG